ncbi:hypothetical protein B0H13DRAFT_2332302 [Mycena leptocephala]|nr:hypothetical protein B0H13DRAFT_2332302 [Mycena leptocephala]
MSERWQPVPLRDNINDLNCLKIPVLLYLRPPARFQGRAITLSERIDACVLTPATAAVTTLGMCVATVLPLPFYILNL